MLDEYRQKIDAHLAEYRHTTRTAKAEQLGLQEAERRLQQLTEASQWLQQFAIALQETAHEQVSAIVSSCLQSVFDEPYEFRIAFERKRGKTEARLLFVRDELEIDPLSAAGGGVVDVAAFALRLACLVLSQPQVRRLLVLDEPFRFVSAEYRPALHQMITSLSEELNVQFILVTHFKDLEIGKVVEL